MNLLFKILFIKNYCTSVTSRTAAPLSRLKSYFGLTFAELNHTQYALLELPVVDQYAPYALTSDTDEPLR